MALRIAVVGANGAVGEELLEVLYESGIKEEELELIVKSKSEVDYLDYGEDSIETIEFENYSKERIRETIFVLACKKEVSKKYIPVILENKGIVIDCSSYSIFHENILNIFQPEINLDSLKTLIENNFKNKGILISLPTSLTSSLLSVLYPLYNSYGLSRAVISTYQGVCCYGKKGMDDLWKQTRALYNQQEIEGEIFKEQIAFNCEPKVGEIEKESFLTEEELRVKKEVPLLLNDETFKISITSVVVPVFSTNSLSVNVSLKKSFKIEEIKKLLLNSPGLILMDGEVLPSSLTARRSSAIYVGRVREDDSYLNSINMWIVSDALYKGAAINIYQIIQKIKESVI